MKRDPSERPSYRYIKVKIHSEGEISFSQLLEAYWDKVPEFIGVRELSDAEAWLIKNKFDKEDQEAVVRVERKFEDDMRAALTTVDDFSDNPGFLQVVKVSGSISSLS